jgi:cephalosporin hydroxylase
MIGTVRYTFDLDKHTLTSEADGEMKVYDLYSPETFATIGRLWIAVGWAQRYTYRFTWLGRPIIQLPEDILRYQEVVYHIKPDVILETGVAHGGSLVLSASLCRVLGKGRVIGVDIEIRPQNRAAVEHHELAGLITLIEGSSIDRAVVERVKSLINPNDTVLVVLDSNHSKAYVLAELAAYAPLVTPGSYIIATDGVMRELANVPGSDRDWEWNNPAAAAEEFAASNSGFVIDPPSPFFNESRVLGDITYWPSAWLRRKLPGER